VLRTAFYLWRSSSISRIANKILANVLYTSDRHRDR